LWIHTNMVCVCVFVYLFAKSGMISEPNLCISTSSISAAVRPIYHDGLI
jgi:hypothetical protein